MTKTKEVTRVEVDAARLREGFERALKFISKDATMPIITYVHMVARDGQLEVESTDRYKVLIFDVGTVGNECELDVLLTSDAVRSVVVMLKAADSPNAVIEVRAVKRYNIDVTELTFTVGGEVFVTDAAESSSPYPPLKRLFPPIPDGVPGGSEFSFSAEHLKAFASVPSKTDSVFELHINPTKPCPITRGDNELSLLMPIVNFN